MLVLLLKDSSDEEHSRVTERKSMKVDLEN